VEKILVVGPSWVGDMVMAQSLFKLLRQRHPGCTIDVLAPAWSLPILERMPEVRQGIVLSLGHGVFGIKERYRLGVSLRGEGYTRAIVLPRSWKSALVPFFANIPLRTGFLGEQRYGLLNDRRKLDKKRLNQTVKRFVALGLEPQEAIEAVTLENPGLQADAANLQRVMQQLALAADKPAVALMPGAEYGPAKQWPLANFRQLAEALAAKGFQIWVLGGPKDQPAGAEICAGNHPHIHNLCGKTQLADVVDLLHHAQHAVTNDSGLMHVAAAVGTKVHAIYGSSSPEFTPPLTANKHIHWLQLECSPCFKRTCPLGHLDCLNKITVDIPMREIVG